jgi:Tfp pilus assembly protein PilO
VFSRREKALLVAAAVAVIAVTALQLAATLWGGASADEARALARWRALKKHLQSLEARVAAVTGPSSSAVPRLLRAAQASAQATGISLTSIRPRRPTRMSTGCMEHSVEMQASGRFPDVVKFIVDIEAKNRLVQPGRVAITATDGKSDMVNATIVLSTYSAGELNK